MQIQPTIRLSTETPMEELEERSKDLKGFATLQKKQQNPKPDLTVLPGTNPPTKEYTWRDP